MERAFEAAAQSDQSNSLQGSISVTVSEVLPNGVLRIQGEKWLKLNQGDEYIRITGLVRPQDIGKGCASGGYSFERDPSGLDHGHWHVDNC